MHSSVRLADADFGNALSCPIEGGLAHVGEGDLIMSVGWQRQCERRQGERAEEDQLHQTGYGGQGQEGKLSLSKNR